MDLKNVYFFSEFIHCESAFVFKWCFGVMTMWLVGLMTITKFISVHWSNKSYFKKMVEAPFLKGKKV